MATGTNTGGPMGKNVPQEAIDRLIALFETPTALTGFLDAAESGRIKNGDQPFVWENGHLVVNQRVYAGASQGAGTYNGHAP